MPNFYEYLVQQANLMLFKEDQVSYNDIKRHIILHTYGGNSPLTNTQYKAITIVLGE